MDMILAKMYLIYLPWHKFLILEMLRQCLHFKLREQIYVDSKYYFCLNVINEVKTTPVSSQPRLHCSWQKLYNF